MNQESFSCEYETNSLVVLKWISILVRTLSLFILCCALLVLMAWNFKVELLTSFSSFSPPMSSLTAIEFVLIGLAMLLLSYGKYKRIAFFILSLVILIAALKIMDAIGFNIPIDQIFFHDKLTLFNPPSRMAPFTAINFILSALCMLLVNNRRLAQHIALFIIVSNLLFFIGYSFGLSILSQLRMTAYNSFIFLSPSALLTAFLFIVTGFIILIMHPQIGFTSLIVSRGRISLIARRLAIMALVIPILIVFLGTLLSNQKYIEPQLGSAIFVFLSIILSELIIFQNSRELEDINIERCAEEFKINQVKAFDESMLSSIGDGVVAIDNAGIILFMNRVAEELLEIHGEQSIGKHYADVWLICDKEGKVLPTSKRPLQISLNTGRKIVSTLIDHYSCVTKNKMVPISITTSPIILDDQRVGVIGVFRDISIEVGIDRAKSEFISLASHQLRTPSTAIGWMVETFLKKYGKKLDADQHRSLDDIYRANKMMKDLVEDFLNISRIELSSSKIVLKRVDISLLISQMIDGEFKTQIIDKKIAVRKDCGKEFVINTDDNLFKVAMHNLISNAIKYAPNSGRVEVSVKKVRVGDRAGNKEVKRNGCVLSVSDNGIGIPKQEQNQVFSRLFRAQNVREKNIEGTGLGLYMVKLFTERLNGEVWFKSEENKGSEFFIFLPELS